jgi:beta-xylosidase
MIWRTACSLVSILAACHAASKGGYYRNPVILEDTPDPGVFQYNGSYYVIATSAQNYVTAKYPIYKSTDLVNYELVSYVFPSPEYYPPWVTNDYWAPELHEIPKTGEILAYYTARRYDGHLCIGVARSTTGLPEGPFQDLGVLVDDPYYGVIDATFYYDAKSDQQYVIFKIDGNDKGDPTPIYIAELDDSGTRVVSSWTKLIVNDVAWESMLVEAPWIVEYNNEYYLLYSGSMGFYYAVGVAKSKSIMGPYTKFANNPILHTDYEKTPEPSKIPGLVGPGHCSLLQTAPDTWVMWYHVWPNDVDINFGQPRYTAIDTVEWTTINGETWPVVKSGVPSEFYTPIPAH